jgi:DNA ligase 1
MKLMLAATVENSAILRYPLLASPKLDGVRAMVKDGVVMSRNMKPIPNAYVQQLFGKKQWTEGLDGELIVGLPTDKNCFRNTMSGVTSADGRPNVTFWVFDYIDDCKEFVARLKAAVFYIKNRDAVQHVHHQLVESESQLLEFEELCLVAGYEGVMLRDPMGRYKHGRSTLREGGLLKLKRFEDAEAVVIGYEELMHNGNEATKDELGRTKRSSHQANKTGRNMLGALHVQGPGQLPFHIGTGFDDATRTELWIDPERMLGRTVKYRYFPSGSKERPRFPVFLGFRDPIDL